MVFSCGIDIEEKERFNKHYFERGRLSDLMYDIFTTKEIENFSIFGKEAFLKGFSFKEAFYKAINNSDFGFKDIEIIFENENQFRISFSKSTRAILDNFKISDVKADFQEKTDFVISKVLLII
ncbi:MAG: 4'-phosphopantetheinyl transferase superfamily protein [Bacteroidales bacterium]|nr:4'-phosphopantetheinyl transferase superfamily protein [Bacteroidales bacterium]